MKIVQPSVSESYQTLRKGQKWVIKDGKKLGFHKLSTPLGDSISCSKVGVKMVRKVTAKFYLDLSLLGKFCCI